MIGNPKWEQRFLGLAQCVAQWSKDPSTKTGAVIADSANRVVGIGYNGFPRGVRDDEARYAERAVKYKLVVHCEANAILNAVAKITESCTIYSTKFPCTDCTKLIIQSGIGGVVAPARGDLRMLSDSVHPKAQSLMRWAEDAEYAYQMMVEAGLMIKEIG